jgi:serine/threonine protein kinase/Flp pilus assembly protein TadD
MNAEELFNAALSRPPTERPEFLAGACAGDKDLKRRVEALLHAHDNPGSFLAGPAPALAGTMDEPRRERPGTAIGPYKLIEQIGEGGMGTVWMAQQTEPVKRLVAVKLIKAGMDSAQVIARFEAERQALALMDHPNISRVLDGGTTDTGRPYFVMDLVKGVPITRYCDEHRLTPRQRLELFLPVCQAVQHAHQKGIIHRDLKPSNVIVAVYDGRPVPKVIDFGVAKAAGQSLTDKTLVTGFGAIVGTLEYMSPEQAEVNQLDIDTRSDIYSLGVLLYELLTGSPPFTQKELEKAGMLEMLRVIREQEPSKPSTKLSSSDALPTLSANRSTEPAKLTKLVRGELDWIVMKALEKDRGRRYETANGFAMDVQRYLADEPVQACPPSAWYRFRKFARRKKAALVVAACVFLALAGIAGSIGWAVRDKGAREQLIEREQQAREKALDEVVETTLDETRPLMEREKWSEALAAVERADKLLAAAGRADRPPRLLDLHKALSMAQRLEDIHYGTQRVPTPVAALSGNGESDDSLRVSQPAAEEEFYWGRQQDPRFAKDFQDFGIDVDALEPTETAARIARSSIRGALVRALDNWAAVRRRARGNEDPAWKKLVEIARQADPNDLRNRCREALLLGDRHGLEKLVDAVPIGHLPPATLWLLGTFLNDLGARDEAVAFLRQAQHEHPEDMWINNSLGWYCWRESQPPLYDDAIRFYSINLALQPHHAAVHGTVAQIWLEKEAVNEAIAEYSRVIDLTPGDAWAWRSRGWAYSKFRQYDKAIPDLSKAIELMPNDACAWNNRGFAHHQLRQYGKAVADYSKAIELKPDFAMAWNDRGAAHSELRDDDKAMADFSKAVALDPKIAGVHSNLGTLLLRQKKVPEAIAAYKKAIELDPKLSLAHNGLGVLLCDHLKQPDKAAESFRKAIALDGNNPDYHFNLGNALHDERKLNEAIGAYRKAIELDPKRFNACPNLAFALNNLAWALASDPEPARRDPGRAVSLAKEAVDLQPRNGAYWNTLGAAQYRAGKWKEAVTALEKSMELRNGGDAVDWFFLAMAHWQLRDKDKARKWYDNAVEWMDKNAKDNDELRRFRTEAEELLEIKKK